MFDPLEVSITIHTRIKLYDTPQLSAADGNKPVRMVDEPGV